MEPFGTKITAFMVVVLYSFLLLQTSSVEAMDILAYTNKSGCSGSAIGCYNVPANRCCYFNSTKSTVRARSMTSCQRANVYSRYRCDYDLMAMSTGPDYCWYGNDWAMTGCRWSSYCTTSTTATQEGSGVRGLPGADSATCNSITLPNAVMYSAPGSSTGTWILSMSSDKVDDMLEQLDNVPDDQKVTWLQSAGAHFETDLTTGTTSKSMIRMHEM